MSDWDEAGLARALDLLPQRLKGPGGVAGVVKDGSVVARRAWGHASMERRLAMTSGTRLPICSISKQFTVAALLDQVEDMADLDPFLAEYLPNYTDPLPSVRNLADMQSGLRDYWALTVLQGAFPEQEFRRSDALPMIAGTKTGHFAPGTSYSYSNGNFRLLGSLVERAAGRPLGEVLAERIFRPAGMATAELMPDTRRNADGVTGYEGNDAMGFLPALNGIWWEGDAGVSASLDDMLAWEVFIDQTRQDPAGLYNRLSAAPRFTDGTPASYGLGLSHALVAGRATTGHGGAIRGFRCHRRHVASERLSVVVMLNHEADAHGAALGLIEAALGWKDDASALDARGWPGLGLWLDAEDGLALRVLAEGQEVVLHYGTTPARLKLGADGVARGKGLSLARRGDALEMRREEENRVILARPLAPVTGLNPELAGRYWSEELQAWMELGCGDGAAWASFDGFLGRGPVERVYPLAQDIWQMPTRRSMDASPPGDWTIILEREGGQVTGLTIGCWLARRVAFRKV